MENENTIFGNSSVDFLNELAALLSAKNAKNEPIGNRVVGHRVPATEANPCLQEFPNLIFNVPDQRLPAKLRMAFSRSVTFSNDELLNWLTEMVSLGKEVVNNIKVVFGIYTDTYVDNHAPDIPDSKRNRISAFLCPYLDDKQSEYPQDSEKSGKVDVYNLGGLYP